MKTPRCRFCGMTYRCRLCGLDSPVRQGYISQGEHAQLCADCYTKPTVFGWQLGDMLQPGAFRRWLAFVWKHGRARLAS